MEKQILDQILADHQLWLTGKGGKKANLYGANLSHSDLFGANLTNADLSRADLSHAHLTGANLFDANLSDADLTGANLYCADLSRANLAGANLSGANLFNTKTDHPIYQFFIGKHHAVATPIKLQIGCKVQPWSDWLVNYKTVGKEHDYTDDEIDSHYQAMLFFYKLLTGKTN